MLLYKDIYIKKKKKKNGMHNKKNMHVFFKVLVGRYKAKKNHIRDSIDWKALIKT